MQRGLLDPEKVDPFQLFLETGGLTYCLYKDSERVLGNTFGMCILQVAFDGCLLMFQSLLISGGLYRFCMCFYSRILRL